MLALASALPISVCQKYYSYLKNMSENSFNPKCFRCGHDLIIMGNDEWGDEESNRTYYECPHCGDCYEELEIPDSQKKRIQVLEKCTRGQRKRYLKRPPTRHRNDQGIVRQRKVFYHFIFNMS